MADFTNELQFAGLLNPTRVRVEAERPSRVSVNGPKTKWPPIAIYTWKFCSTIKLSFDWTGTLINKFAAFGVMIIHKPLPSQKVIGGVLYRQRESLVHIFTKMNYTVNGKSYRATIIPLSYLYGGMLMWTTLDYNKMAPNEIQPTKHVRNHLGKIERQNLIFIINLNSWS